MKTDELSDRLVGSALGALDVWSICLGDSLGLYPALRRGGALTAPELADAAGIHPRYATEWLEHQTVVGLLDVDDAALPADQRRYSIPEEHTDVLTNPDSLAYLTPMMRALGSAGAQLPALVEAYRSGGGVGWAQYGPGMRSGQADSNRPWFLSALGSEWFPTVPDLHAALSAGVRVADVGCGEGWSSIGMALAYPDLRVDGYDVDDDSVRQARRHAESGGVADRVRFHAADVADVAEVAEVAEVAHARAAAPGGGYDVVTAFECIHDLSDPVAVLTAMRRMVRPGGQVIVMDERVAEEFGGASEDLAERLMYGYSLLICLPDGMSRSPSAGTGTVMRPSTLRRYAQAAGFTDIEVLPIETDLWRFYRLLLSSPHTCRDQPKMG